MEGATCFLLTRTLTCAGADNTCMLDVTRARARARGILVTCLREQLVQSKS